MFEFLAILFSVCLCSMLMESLVAPHAVLRAGERVSNHGANAWLKYSFFLLRFRFISFHGTFHFPFSFEYLFFFLTQTCEEKYENHSGKMKNHVRCATLKRDRKKGKFIQLYLCKFVSVAVAVAICYSLPLLNSFLFHLLLESPHF